MFDEKFLKFIEIWQNDFVIDQTIRQKQSFDKNKKPLPWYTYPAIEYLCGFDFSSKNVFEFGCATSSLFWAERALNVTSIENDLNWYQKWQKEFKKSNLEILYRPNDYAKAILETGKKFDVIVIDGIDRLNCAQTALEALSNEGMIIFDDSDRANKSQDIAKALQLLKEKGLFQVDFYGFCPMNIYPKTTSIFFTRNFNFKTLSSVQPQCGIGSLWGLSRQKRKELYRFQIKKDEM